MLACLVIFPHNYVNLSHIPKVSVWLPQTLTLSIRFRHRHASDSKLLKKVYEVLSSLLHKIFTCFLYIEISGA